jgi:hypothetical protein
VFTGTFRAGHDQQFSKRRSTFENQKRSIEVLKNLVPQDAAAAENDQICESFASQANTRPVPFAT